MRFVVVRDRARIAAVADVYQQCWQVYASSTGFAGKIRRDSEELHAQQQRVASSATYLAEHMADCPVLVLGCTTSRRVEGVAAGEVGSALGNSMPAMWSFMLAARARRLGPRWTTIHFATGKTVADI